MAILGDPGFVPSVAIACRRVAHSDFANAPQKLAVEIVGIGDATPQFPETARHGGLLFPTLGRRSTVTLT